MSETETQTLKERCEKVMKDHLEKIAFRGTSKRIILNELPNMWRALEEAGLMPEILAAGYTYKHFCDRAYAKAKEAAMFEFLSNVRDRRS